VAAIEVMVNNSRVADLIRDQKVEEIPDAISEGEFFDMQTFTDALIEHVVAGEVDRDVAANAATNRHDFLVALEQALKRKVAGIDEEAMLQPAPEPEPPEEQPMPGLRVAGAPEG
jgi:twitching motility protein PilT